jgi:hypothetical protein
MAKYDGIKENIGEIMVAELFANLNDTYITENELFKTKLIKKFNEIYNLAHDECLSEIKELTYAINSLKVK